MRKILLYIVFGILLIFLIPILFTNGFEMKETNGNVVEEIKQTEEVNTSSYDYKDYNVIKLLHEKSNEIEELSMDEYLYGVVAAEMPVDFEIEALKAQAIVARTYTLYKIRNSNSKHEGADICDSAKCCQAWISKEERFERWEEDKREDNWNKIVKCVNETAGKVIVYNRRNHKCLFSFK